MPVASDVSANLFSSNIINNNHKFLIVATAVSICCSQNCSQMLFQYVQKINLELVNNSQSEIQNKNCIKCQDRSGRIISKDLLS